MKKIYQIISMITLIFCLSEKNIQCSDIQTIKGTYNQLVAQLTGTTRATHVSTCFNQENQSPDSGALSTLTLEEKNRVANAAFRTAFESHCLQLDQRLTTIQEKTDQSIEDRKEKESQAYYQTQKRVQQVLENLLTILARTSSKNERIKFTPFGLEIADPRLPSMESAEAIYQGAPIIIITSIPNQKLSRTQIDTSL